MSAVDLQPVFVARAADPMLPDWYRIQSVRRANYDTYTLELAAQVGETYFVFAPGQLMGERPTNKPRSWMLVSLFTGFIVGSVLRHQPTKVRVGPTPDVRCFAKQSPRRPLESILASLWGIVKRVRGSRGRRRLGLRTQERMKCPRCSTETLKERRRGAAMIRECERCKGVWLERAVLKVLITGAKGKSDAGVMSRVRQWEETFESAVQQ